MTASKAGRWTWARDQIQQLDVEQDYHRIARLSFVVRYGTPMFLHGLFSVAFVYNVGMPAMARILHRGGRGPILRDTRKRNFDSLVFFGELYRHGDSEPSWRIAERLVRIHANFPIDNRMSLYTLATLSCLPRRISEDYLGERGLSDKECEAQYRFWRRMGELMQVRDIPGSQEAFLDWMRRFEQEEFQPSPECTEITAALAQEWSEYWFPAPLRRTGRGLFYALIDPALRRRLQLPEPHRLHCWLARQGIRALFFAKRWLPDPADRQISDYFGRAYGARPDIRQVGYKAESP